MKIFISLFAFTTFVFASNEFKECDQIIKKQTYKICYDYHYKGAKYVSYILDGSLVNKTNIKKRPSFFIENTIPKQYQSTKKDYYKSGYDKGHLANDSSFDNNIYTLQKTYSLANIIPQSPKVNRYTWIKTERYERALAVKYGSIKVLIGVIYDKEPLRIGINKIAIPKAYYKKLYDDTGFEECYYYKNDINIVSKGDKLHHHLVKCNTIHTIADTHTQKIYTFTQNNQKIDTHLHKKATDTTHKYDCNTKKYCKDMSSCKEALFYLNICNIKRLDRNNNGVPCEKLCK